MNFIHAYTPLTLFERCPKQFAHKYVWKDLPREPASEAMQNGIDTHKALEHRIKGKPLAAPYTAYERYARVFDGAPVEAELQLGVTRAGEATGFFADNVWFRGKVDVAVVLPPRAFITDWKTGRKQEDPDELEIFALLVQAKFPTVTSIVGRYAWLKTREIGKEHDLSATAEKWQSLKERCAKVEAAIDAGFFPPKEHQLCGWCAVKSCQFNPKRG